MTLLILLSLLITAPVAAAEAPKYCEGVREVVMEAVEEGLLSINEANELLARCARAPDL